MSHNIVWIIGAGNMAKEYAKILLEIGIEFYVIGRGEKSAANFESEIGLTVVRGGIQNYLSKTKKKPEYAIVCVNDEKLADITLLLLKYDINKILVEKPGGLLIKEVETVAKMTNEKNAKVYVAYNRRFYSSVRKVKEIINEDNGVKSFYFEFTEWSHIVEHLTKSKVVFENWLLANSSHVIDLAFFLGGKPKEISTYILGGLTWHPSGSIFSGAGISDKQALFSYCANWESPGRWGIEILTKKHRLILRPLEKLQIQKIGHINIEEYPIDDTLDIKYKPGLFRQVQKFLDNDFIDFININEQLDNIRIYNKISGQF